MNLQTYLWCQRECCSLSLCQLCVPKNRGLITCCWVCCGAPRWQTQLNFRTASNFFWSRVLCNLICYRFLTTSACQPCFQLCAFASRPKMGGFAEAKKEWITTKPPFWVSSLGNGAQLQPNDCDILPCYINKKKTIFFCNMNTARGVLDHLNWLSKSCLNFQRHFSEWQNAYKEVIYLAGKKNDLWAESEERISNGKHMAPRWCHDRMKRNRHADEVSDRGEEETSTCYGERGHT